MSAWLWAALGVVGLTVVGELTRNWLHTRRPELGEGWSEAAVEQLRREALAELEQMDDVLYRGAEVRAARWDALVAEAGVEAEAWRTVDRSRGPFRDWDASLLHEFRAGEAVDVEALRAEARDQRARADSLHARVLELMAERDRLRRHLALYQDWEA